MFAKKKKAAQGELWVAAHQLPTTAKATFYSRLDETLESFGFADKVRVLCAPAYKNTSAGRPGIDPVVYLKMIMIGFFEDLPSERAIAARCADSMSIRSFLNYSLAEKTPDHSTFTVIRQRLAEMFGAIKASGRIESCLPAAPGTLPRRISIREFLSLARQGIPPAKEISAYVGVEPTTTLSLSDWAVWLLRERLADILVETKK